MDCSGNYRVALLVSQHQCSQNRRNNNRRNRGRLEDSAHTIPQPPKRTFAAHTTQSSSYSGEASVSSNDHQCASVEELKTTSRSESCTGNILIQKHILLFSFPYLFFFFSFATCGVILGIHRYIGPAQSSQTSTTHGNCHRQSKIQIRQRILGGVRVHPGCSQQSGLAQ